MTGSWPRPDPRRDHDPRTRSRNRRRCHRALVILGAGGPLRPPAQHSRWHRRPPLSWEGVTSRLVRQRLSLSRDFVSELARRRVWNVCRKTSRCVARIARVLGMCVHVRVRWLARGPAGTRPSACPAPHQRCRRTARRSRGVRLADREHCLNKPVVARATTKIAREGDADDRDGSPATLHSMVEQTRAVSKAVNRHRRFEGSNPSPSVSAQKPLDPSGLWAAWSLADLPAWCRFCQR